jgi:photosystem II stability/assembly factor-like uncharacterized protein
MLNPDEGWMIGDKGILHYKSGKWTSFDLPRQVLFSKIHMLNENEGWAIGPGGILHYTNR